MCSRTLHSHKRRKCVQGHCTRIPRRKRIQGHYTRRQRRGVFNFIKCPDAVLSGRRLATFQTNLQPPLSFHSEAGGRRLFRNAAGDHVTGSTALQLRRNLSPLWKSQMSFSCALYRRFWNFSVLQAFNSVQRERAAHWTSKLAKYGRAVDPRTRLVPSTWAAKWVLWEFEIRPVMNIINFKQNHT
jgi:hypothetical protein